jgi:hypothetical protein
MNTLQDDRIVNTITLSRLMKENPDHFFGVVYKPNTISQKAARMAIPARQLGVKSKYAIGRVIPGKYTFELGEIVRWIKRGADRAACLEVLRERSG